MKCGDYIWNHIQISTNMPSIGLKIWEIVFEIEEFCEKKIEFCIMKSSDNRAFYSIEPSTNLKCLCLKCVFIYLFIITSSMSTPGVKNVHYSI